MVKAVILDGLSFDWCLFGALRGSSLQKAMHKGRGRGQSSSSSSSSSGFEVILLIHCYWHGPKILFWPPFAFLICIFSSVSRNIAICGEPMSIFVQLITNFWFRSCYWVFLVSFISTKIETLWKLHLVDWKPMT